MQINPAYKDNNIAIVLAADGKFVPYLSVALQSLVDNSTEKYNYDIIILFSEQSVEVERRLAYLSRKNVSIRFVDVQEHMLRNDEEWYSRAHYSTAMYYRFFIPELFANYSKILYLDSDIIIESDIAELFNIDLDDKYVAAVKDFHLAITEHLSTYAKDVLNISPDKYFNSGVMLFNVDKLKKINFVEQCMDTLKQLGTPFYPDQDVLNIICCNKVKYLDIKFNLFQMDLNDSDFLDQLPETVAAKFKTAAENFYILHYAGWQKPWKNPKLVYADYFWKYARKTPYYEVILYSNIKSSALTGEQVRNVIYRKKLYMNYMRCKILKLLTFGKKCEHYKNKAKKLKAQITDYRRTLRK